MIIYIDTFNNMIKVFRAETKKETPYYFEQEFDFDISNLDNKLKAISLFTASEGGLELKKSRYNQLVFSDDILMLGMMSLKNVGRQKYFDVFTTQLRLSYPRPDINYYYEGYEYDRDDKNVYYSYELAKRETVNKITTVFKNAGISLGERNVLASIFCVSDKNTAPYPIPVLVVGKYNSELIIVKGEKILSINIFGYGSELLLDGTHYMNSGYYNNNDRSIKFASFIKQHIVTGEDVTDSNINNFEGEEALKFVEPKEIRILKEKEDKLHAYNIHNNFRKFYARLLEITDYYSKKPWFFPLKEISVVAEPEVMANLIDIVRDDNTVRFIALYQSINDVVEKGIVDNPMYQKGIKKERRKIDWKAILNMEIGGKKKKA